MKYRSIFLLLIAFALLNSNRTFAEDATLSSYYEIAKQNCYDIASIRVEMDRINNEILELLTERTAYVQCAGDLKSRTNKIADDRQRVADQEQKIINKSRELELPIEISVPAFRAIMETSIKFQQGYIDQLVTGSTEP
jgi:chorismate mutase